MADKKKAKKIYEPQNALEFEFTLKLRGKEILHEQVDLHEDLLTMRGGAFQMSHSLNSIIQNKISKLCREHSKNG